MRRRVYALPLVTLLLLLASAAKSLPSPHAVDLIAPDGAKLKATYFAAGKSGPGILLLHQCNQDRRAWDDLAQRLAASGLSVLTMDYRGFGESAGPRADQVTPEQRAQIIAEKWPSDIDAGLQYLKSQPGTKRDIIGVGGASCGVNQSIQAARRHPEVKSLVLLSGATDREGRQFLQKSQVPMLMSAADDDGNAVTIMQWLFDLTPNPGNRFVHYQTGGHGNEMFATRKELPGMIVDWFNTTLVKTPGKAPPADRSSTRSGNSEILKLIDQPGGAAKAAQMLAEARQGDPKATAFSEDIVNVLGYEHLQSGDAKGAIEILKLNASAYPNSPNVYDSLSDAYLADGENELARENAQKALDLLASDTVDNEQRRNLIKQSAERKLKQLEPAPK